MQSRIGARISVVGLAFLGCLLSAAPFARAQNPVRLSALPQGLLAAVESCNASNRNRPVTNIAPSTTNLT
jgi:predicted naringenin-chalcone synthase